MPNFVHQCRANSFVAVLSAAKEDLEVIFVSYIEPVYLFTVAGFQVLVHFDRNSVGADESNHPESLLHHSNSD